MRSVTYRVLNGTKITFRSRYIVTVFSKLLDLVFDEELEIEEIHIKRIKE